jgi:hypothetical protein
MPNKFDVDRANCVADVRVNLNIFVKNNSPYGILTKMDFKPMKPIFK